ncbi:hypothetical protein SSTU70S_04928 [Stutzerimonas stutzeri]
MPYITDEQADHLFGVDRKRAKALERIAVGNAWFASEEKAQAFVEANAIGDTHVAVQTRDNRWDIVAAPVADQAATVELATIAPVAKPALGRSAVRVHPQGRKRPDPRLRRSRSGCQGRASGYRDH